MNDKAAPKRCGATIEKEWPGHRVVLSRRYCRAWPLKGYDHCFYHLTVAERERRNEEAEKLATIERGRQRREAAA